MPEIKEQVQRALNQAYFYLKFRPRTKREVLLYLQKKAERFHWSQEVIDLTLKNLEEQNLVNDRNFIEWFIDQRSSVKQKSMVALRSEMMRLGIEKDLLEEYFEEHELPEEELAYQALSLRWYRFKRLPKKERFQKAAQFLTRRGFGFGTIKNVIARLEEINQ